jgi:hypothetical protein
MKTRRPSKPRARIPQVAHFHHREPGDATIHFPMPRKSSPDLDELLIGKILAAVNRALYDFNRVTAHFPASPVSSQFQATSDEAADQKSPPQGQRRDPSRPAPDPAALLIPSCEQGSRDHSRYARSPLKRAQPA